MANSPNAALSSRQDRYASVLVGCAIFAGGASAILAALSVMRGLKSDNPTPWDLLAYPIIFLFAGIVCVGLLAGIASLLRSRESRPESAQTPLALSGSNGELRGLPTNGELSDPPTAIQRLALAAAHPLSDRVLVDPGAPRVDPSTADMRWAEVVALLRELRDNSLLSESQRAEKRAALATEELHRGRDTIRDLLRDGQFVGARRAIDDLRRRFPELSGLDELTNEVEQARARAEAEDLAVFTRRTDELMSISAWDRAADVAMQLQERHPGNAAAALLVQRVTRERDLFKTEQRRRTYAEIQRFIERRRWREAVAAARAFLEEFPTCTDAEVLRGHLPTLVVNAEIEERQELEAQITDLAKHCRYIEAYNLARYVIDRFPQSPQADALKLQITRLKELAHDPNAAPARVRVEE